MIVNFMENIKKTYFKFSDDIFLSCITIFFHFKGCIALTEMGSNNKNEIRTTASFDPVNKDFVLHSPDFEAAKCWQPNLGMTLEFFLIGIVGSAITNLWNFCYYYKLRIFPVVIFNVGKIFLLKNGQMVS